MNRTAKDLMTDELISVAPGTNLLEVRKKFAEYDIHHIPVIDRDGRAVGIISKPDYNILKHHFTLMKIGNYEAENEKFIGALIVDDVMSKNPSCISANTSLEEILDLFVEERQFSLLITENEKCIGIVTPYDILKALRK